jgi:diguanylate cyclase (GGDEF)-like protein
MVVQETRFVSRLSVALSGVVFVAFTGVFGVWLETRPGDAKVVFSFFLVGVALVAVDLIRQLFTMRTARRLYDRAVEDADRAQRLNLQLQAAQAELRSKNLELASANEQLTTLAGTDAVTGLPNQRNMSYQIDAEIERSRRTKRPFSVLFLDLDRFKRLNDTYGHLVGDEALREFSTVVKSTLRHIDVLGRWGGEEFVVLLPEATEQDAFLAGERVRSLVAGHIYRLRGDGLYLTCSVGVATYPIDGHDRSSLVNMADHAMYVAKKLGRNQVRSTRDPAFALGDDDEKTTLPGQRRSWSSLAVADAVEHLLDDDHRGSPYTHALCALSIQLAQTMGLSEEESFKIGLAAQLQNVGNVAIPDAVLQKRTSLTPEERAIVQRHPEVGADIVAGVAALADLAPIIRAHHEWWNGQGYPNGLKEDAIPIGARIVAVIDVYKALTTERPHRPARSPRVAFEELRFRTGTQFDPTVVDALQRALAPNQVITERILVDAYSRSYRENAKRPVRLMPPRKSLLLEES